MKDFLAKHLIGLGTIIAALVSIIGVTINNIFISQYLSTDYAILNTKAVYTGFCFLLLLIATTLFYLSFIGIKDITKNSFRDILANFIFKPILCTNGLYAAVAISNETPRQLYLTATTNFYVVPFTAISFWLSIMLVAFGKIYIKNEQMLSKFYKIIFVITCIMAIVPFVVLVSNDLLYRNIAHFFGLYSFFLFAIFIQHWTVEKDNEKGLNVEYASLFCRDKNSNLLSLDFFFALVWVLFTFVSVISDYSKGVFPYVNQEYGGGRPIPVVVELIDQNLIYGKLIYQDDKRYYVLNQDNSVSFISLDKISKISK